MSEKIATMDGVHEYGEGDPVELWEREGHLVVRAYNECHNNVTDVDLVELLGWLRAQKHTSVGERIREFIGE